MLPRHVSTPLNFFFFAQNHLDGQIKPYSGPTSCTTVQDEQWYDTPERETLKSLSPSVESLASNSSN